MSGDNRGMTLLAKKTRARLECAALESEPEVLWKLASRHIAEIRLDALPAGPTAALALWSAVMPDGRIRVSRRRGLEDPVVEALFEVRDRGIWPRRMWYLTPRPLRDMRRVVPTLSADFAGSTRAAGNFDSRCRRCDPITARRRTPRRPRKSASASRRTNRTRRDRIACLRGWTR
ncbi:MAG: hypothetical protein V3T86_16755 [Planctomycetota bacterium]